MGYNVYPDIFLGGTARGEADDRAMAQYSRMWRVVFDVPVVDTNFVGSLPEFQKIFEYYPSDAYAGLRKIVPRQTEDPFVWDVEMQYSRQLNDQKQFNVPLLRPPRVEWGTNQFDKAFNYDINGDLVCGSAGDPLLGDTVEDSRTVATVVFNVDQTPTWVLQYRNRINTAPFVLDNVFVDYKCCRIASIRISGWHNELSTYYREVALTLEMRDPYIVSNASIGSFDTGITATVGSSCTRVAKYQVQGWQKAILDQGWTYYDGSNHKVKALDDNNMQPSQPMLLDGIGGKLAFLTSAVGSEYFRVYDAYQAVDFSVLNLPASTS